MTITEERLAELERLAEAATPGPWEWTSRTALTSRDGDIVLWTTNVLSHPSSDDRAWAESLGACGNHSEDHAKDNADFIAAARTAVPELIAEVRRLRAEVEVCPASCGGRIAVERERGALRAEVERLTAVLAKDVGAWSHHCIEALTATNIALESDLAARTAEVDRLRAAQHRDGEWVRYEVARDMEAQLAERTAECERLRDVAVARGQFQGASLRAAQAVIDQDWDAIDEDTGLEIAQAVLMTAAERDDALDQLAAVTAERDRLQEAFDDATSNLADAYDTIAEWKDATGLEKGGDPGGVEPEDLRRFVIEVTAQRDKLLNAMNDVATFGPGCQRQGCCCMSTLDIATEALKP